MDAIVTLRVTVRNLSEAGLLVLKQMVQEDEERTDEISDREAIIFAALEWLADGHTIGGETYKELYAEHGVNIFNRETVDVTSGSPG